MTHHLFKPGNKYAVGHGRPPKHPYIKTIESGFVSIIPAEVIDAISRGDRKLLNNHNIPHKQVTDTVRYIATGYLHLKGETHE